MNDIFLLLWLADVVGSVGIIGVILTIGLTACLGVMLIILSAAGDDDEIPVACKKYFSLAKWWLIIVAVAIAIPSPTTVKALAVMRAGEYAVASPLGEKSIKALDAVLDRVIAESKKSGK